MREFHAMQISFAHFVWLWNRDQGLGTPALHLELAEWLDDRWRAGDRKLLLMVFRNAGKSTLVGLFAAWLLARDPNLRILVVAAEQGLSIKMTRNIRQIVEQHPAAAHLKTKSPQEWAADRLTVQRTRSLRDPSVLARGLSGNLTGCRADVIICDDIEVPNTCDTPAKRADLRLRLKELDFVLVPGGSQLFVGTPHNYFSIYSDNLEPETSENIPTLGRYTKKIVPIVDAEGESRWPERYDQRSLNELSETVGPQQYKSQMMLEPTHHAAVRLDPGLLKTYSASLDLAWRNGLPTLSINETEMAGAACWWDPAYGRPEGGDGSVIACVFTDHQGRYWLHDLEYLTFDPGVLEDQDEATQLCGQVIDFVIRNEQPSVTIENNGIGRFLPGLLRKMANHRRAGIAIHDRASTGNKARRILEAFDPVLASGHLLAHEKVMHSPFVSEMREWRADGRSRDDGLDAVAGCLRSQPVRLNGLFLPPSAARWSRLGRVHQAKTHFAV